MRFTEKNSQFLFIGLFIGLIVTGTVLLRLPCCSWPDAVFTATSAVCVTGLETVKVAELSWFGQFVVLVLIQFGGIGIMTLTTWLLLMLGHELSHGETLIMSHVSDRFSLRGLPSLARVVGCYTLICEGAGLVLLFPLFWFLEEQNWYGALWHAVFHSVSAFCNAGMSTLPDGVADLSLWTKLVVAALFICGGLGFYVAYDIRSAYRTGERLHAQTRLILWWTAGLLFAGTAILWWLQCRVDAPVSFVDAFFQTAACRTAGFSSLDLGKLWPGSIVLIVILMLIGAAPGSTGGGMKVTTFALVMMGLISTLRGKTRVILFKRMIPPENIMKAFVLLVTFVLLSVFGGLCLYGVCGGERGFSLSWAMFEAASALSTVGLELGRPGAIPAAGKFFLIAYMFIGRVGLFTIFLLLLGREHPSRLIYPEERIIVN